MAMPLNASQTTHSKADLTHAEKPMGEMNTTPLIDVMLVLLIMFILTIPIQTHTVEIDLPFGQKGTTYADKNKLIIDAQNQLYWNGEAIDQRRLEQLLAETQKFDVEPELQFQPDAAARYIIVDDTLAAIKRSGARKLGFVGNEHYARVF